MNKKDEFKEFVRNNNYLIKHVNSGDMTWQKFYELYDLYGSDDDIWNNYRSTDTKKALNIDSITNVVKKVDSDSIQKHIGTAQKALELIKDLTTKEGAGAAILSTAKGPISARPISKIFED